MIRLVNLEVARVAAGVAVRGRLELPRCAVFQPIVSDRVEPVLIDGEDIKGEPVAIDGIARPCIQGYMNDPSNQPEDNRRTRAAAGGRRRSSRTVPTTTTDERRDRRRTGSLVR